MKILLHTCCAPCSAAVIEWLFDAGIHPTLYFYNPNIYPRTEYNLRKAELLRYAEARGIEIIEGCYDHKRWLQHVSGHEDESERGKRCLKCFKKRMLATAQLAHEHRFKRFATTLAASRWKSLEQIAQAGHWATELLPDVEFWEKNWRKGGLNERRIELLNENKFYNQNYCGCEYSVNT